MAPSFDYRRCLGRIFRRRRFEQAEKLLSQWVSPPSERFVASMQLKKIQGVWNDAVHNVPYYSELVGKKDAPREITSIKQFVSEVPILSKHDLMENRNLRHRKRKPHRLAMTAGSTGEPFQFGIWKRESEICAINQIVGRLANGMDIDDPIFFIWGHSHLLGTGFRGKLKNVQRKLKDACMSYQRVDAYKLDQASVKMYLRTLERFNPRVVIGYSGALDLFARQSTNIPRRSGIRFVVATSEMLPYGDSKETVEGFFKAPLVMEYGGVDFGVVSYEMMNTSEHRVFWWSHFLEVGKENEIVVTPLYDRYLPLVRFKTGDEIDGPAYFAHGCVKSFGGLLGRKHDALRMSDNKFVHSVGVLHSIHQLESVKGIQLVVDKGNFAIHLVSNGLTDQEMNAIRRRLRELHPTLGEASIRLVKDLGTNIAGKRRWIRTKA